MGVSGRPGFAGIQVFPLSVEANTANDERKTCPGSAQRMDHTALSEDPTWSDVQVCPLSVDRRTFPTCPLLNVEVVPANIVPSDPAASEWTIVSPPTLIYRVPLGAGV